MTVFAVQYTYTTDVALRDEHRPAHRAFLRPLAEQGVLLLSGPFQPREGQADGALLLVQGSSSDDVVAALSADPFQEQGVVAHLTVQEWTPVMGAWFNGPLADQF